jgi:membrane-bound lytic murein transglycosylase D
MRSGFALPNLNSKHVTDYEKWNAEHKTYLDRLFARGTPFLFHIVDEIEKRQLPMELALLPAIESAYKPRAVSRSKAVGLWQFMSPTGRQFGLRQDWWYDGRQDALDSTTAALDYLTQLNKMFDGDWFLALAAYNAGPGTVSRAIKSNKSKGKRTQYQDLKLRSETKRYIPKLIALKNIINNPEKYGVELPLIEDKPYFDIVSLGGQIDIKKFADDAGIDHLELKHLNAGFKRWATSPDGPHRLLIPLNKTGDIKHAELAIQRAPKIRYANHKIEQGDSLSTIARRYGVSVRGLQKSNNLISTNIRAGKTLLIPVRTSTIAQASGVLADDANTMIKADTPTINVGANQQLTHRVKQGDTLWSISRKYKVQVNNLLSWNNISKNQILRLNQTLLVMAN